MLPEVVKIAEQAGQLIGEVRASSFDIESKGSQGPVTEADRRADAFLKQELRALDPSADALHR